MPASEMLLTIKTDTKEEEQEILANFLARLQYSPTSVNQHEQPDFEVTIKDKEIGVEITKYYADFTKKGSKTQQKISEWKKLAVNLKKKLLAIDTDWACLYGAIHFRNDKLNYGQLLTDNYFNELVRLIKLTGLKRKEEKTVDLLENQFPFLAKYITSIYLRDMHPPLKIGPF